MLIIRPNTTHRSSTIIFHYTLQFVSAVQISRHVVDVGDTKIHMKGERLLFTDVQVITILLQKRKVRVSLEQAEVAQGVPGRLRPRIFATFGTTRVVGR